MRVLREEWSATGFLLVIIEFSIASVSFEALAIRRAKKMIWALAIFWAIMVVFGLGVYFYSLKEENKN